MKPNKSHSEKIINYSRSLLLIKKSLFLMSFVAGLILVPIKIMKSEEIFLKCIGKFEINRGALIKPDWEISYLKINLNGLKSSIYDKGIKKEGSTLIRPTSYTITHTDDNKRISSKYRINKEYDTYTVNYPKQSRILIGTCQKGRG